MLNLAAASCQALDLVLSGRASATLQGSQQLRETALQVLHVTCRKLRRENATGRKKEKKNREYIYIEQRVEELEREREIDFQSATWRTVKNGSLTQRCAASIQLEEVRMEQSLDHHGSQQTYPIMFNNG